eukprot:gene11857-8452_t
MTSLFAAALVVFALLCNLIAARHEVGHADLQKIAATTSKTATTSIPLELKFRKADVPLEHADRAGHGDRIPFQVPSTCKVLNDTLELCKIQDPHFDQTYGLAFYHGEPRFLKCAIPPPVDFVFPPKAQLPP